MIDGDYDREFLGLLEHRSAQFAGCTILDVGGHVGYHAMCFARLAGSSGRVHVFEPNPANADRIQKNLERNPEFRHHVEVHRMALADRSGDLRFSASSDVDRMFSAGGHLKDAHQPLSQAAYNGCGFVDVVVAAHTLDELVAEGTIPPPSLIKIDVEGAEHLVLTGACETLRTTSPCLVLELHTAIAATKTMQILAEHGYGTELLGAEEDGRCFIYAQFRGQA